MGCITDFQNACIIAVPLGVGSNPRAAIRGDADARRERRVVRVRSRKQAERHQANFS